MDTVELELDAGNQGWKCSGCGLMIDCIGRPIVGNPTWVVSTTSASWIENKPQWNFCPSCGKKVKKHD